MLKDDRMATRVKLAQAALDYITNEELTPRMSCYLATRTGLPLLDSTNGDEPIKDAVRPCYACALGSLIYAKFKQDPRPCNEVMADNNSAYAEATFAADHLSDLFDPIELCHIEIAYEGAIVGYSGLHRSQQLDDLVEQCESFFEMHTNEDRARKILRSIINNKGAVVPSTFASTEP